MMLHLPDFRENFYIESEQIECICFEKGGIWVETHTNQYHEESKTMEQFTKTKNAIMKAKNGE